MGMTIVDIARIAGVGVSTVSRVINNHPDVKYETRERILDIIRENNYIPNNSARVLKQTNTNNIGILIRGVFNPFFAALLKNISMSIEKAGYSIIVHYHNNVDDVSTLVGFAKEKRLQGVICLGGNFIGVNEESFHGLDIAIVMISVDFKQPKTWKNFSTVSISNEKAGYKATSYLIEKGHKEVAIILGNKQDYSIGKLRYEGYKNACKDYRIKHNLNYVIYGNYDTALSYERTKKFLAVNPQITAIFATADTMAIGAAKAIVDLGYKVGDDISVMGFDGIDIASYYNPSITTIEQPQDELSVVSVKLLIGLLENKVENQHIVLETKLVEGDSVKEKKN
ncbi:LacI family DNA-binding transcriptional regulator [Cellulosilyticum lentocellum]|uniref:Transcriptional regulator, LacI family n=1 Tax=Cellulosilyticum lentocellum (strain ATCC 49066 / DSM 5427 / NCIMB 11756 / RHM5) TaxID=642492 RepID=F2JIP6_CELLD|nr:LacI family DNA-binding transcriptional regulator [Cellulosilyticum lentocellum]ADZ85516.1 transcriptional regulator, LacI family [Cellulosilyticum lentocellum DSM 5427]